MAKRDRHGKAEGPWTEVKRESFLRRLFGNPGNAPSGDAGKGPWENKPTEGFGRSHSRSRPRRGSNRPFDRPKNPFESKKDPWGKKPPKPKGGM